MEGFSRTIVVRYIFDAICKGVVVRGLRVGLSLLLPCAPAPSATASAFITEYQSCSARIIEVEIQDHPPAISLRRRKWRSARNAHDAPGTRIPMPRLAGAHPTRIRKIQRV